MRSDLGNGIMDCLPSNGANDKQRKLRSRGQEGTMIATHDNNRLMMNFDINKKRLNEGEYQVTRGKMGKKGGTTDKRCIELLSPALAIVDRVLNAWPTKLKDIHPAVSLAFDNSKKLSYLNVLVTLGNRDNDRHVSFCLKRDKEVNGHLGEYYDDHAGTVLHNDANNTKGSPSVAIMLGAYDGFDFVYPTIGKTIKAPSGTILVGDMHDLLHGVGGGNGIRLTLVFCQHESCLGKKTQSDGSVLVLNGAKTSRQDTKKKGEEIARIEGLDAYEFE